MNVSKTTLTGALSLAVTVLLALQQMGTLSAKAAGSVAIALAVCRAVVGYLQKDAGETPAIVPGAPVPQIVPSHEVPNNPEAIPVIKETK